MSQEVQTEVHVHRSRESNFPRTSIPQKVLHGFLQIINKDFPSKVSTKSPSLGDVWKCRDLGWFWTSIQGICLNHWLCPVISCLLMMQVRRAKHIVMHEDFDSLSYDSDIALIQLSSALEFNSVVRPVCLPHSLEPLFSSEICVVTGWGSANKGKPFTFAWTSLLIDSFENMAWKRYQTVSALALLPSERQEPWFI